MKMVIAYVQPFVAERVVKALQEIQGLPGATVIECHGFGRGRGNSDAEPLTATSERFSTLRKIRVETMIPDELEDVVLSTIRSAAHTGSHGDGKVYVTSIDRALRIRTGEEGEAGL